MGKQGARALGCRKLGVSPEMYVRRGASGRWILGSKQLSAVVSAPYCSHIAG